MRILAVKTHAAGDLLLATPAFRALRRGFPAADFVLVTGFANAELAPCLPGFAAYMFVDEVALLRRDLRAAYDFYKNMRTSRADKLVLFQPTPRLSRLLSWTGIPVYAPTAGKPPKYLAGAAPWVPNGDKYVAANYVEVAVAAGGQADGLDLDCVIPDDVAAAAALTGWPEDEPYAVVVPSGGRNAREEVPAKIPPPALFSKVLALIAGEAGRAVCLIGGAGDVAVCEKLAAAAPGRVVSLAGRTTVAEAARVIAGAAYVITVDSLPMHLAAAFKRPTLALFGPSNPRALLNAEGSVTAVTPALACAPCYANGPFPPCRQPAKFACREQLPWNAIQDFIQRQEGKG